MNAPQNQDGSAPRLVAVGNEGSDARGPAAAGSPAEQRDWRRTAIWVLLAALVLCGGLFLQERSRSQALETRVAALSADLGQAQEVVAAQELRLDGVRAGVEDLMERLGALQALVWDELSPPRGAAGEPAPSEPSL